MTTIPTIDQLQARCADVQASIDRAGKLMTVATNIFAARLAVRSIRDAEVRDRIDSLLESAMESIREVRS